MDETILQTSYVYLTTGSDLQAAADALTKIYAENPRVKFVDVFPVLTQTDKGFGYPIVTSRGAFLTYWAIPGYKLKAPEWTV